jgi:hypothetical protein
MGLYQEQIREKNLDLLGSIHGFRLLFLNIFFFSPHHGKSVADSFSGEYRKRMENAKMQHSATNFQEFLDMCKEEFKCKTSSPGEERVTFLMYIKLIFFKKVYF